MIYSDAHRPCGVRARLKLIAQPFSLAIAAEFSRRRSYMLHEYVYERWNSAPIVLHNSRGKVDTTHRLWKNVP